MPSGAPYLSVAIRGGFVLAGVLLLVALPPVDETERACETELAGQFEEVLFYAMS